MAQHEVGRPVEDSERPFGIRCEDGGVIACESSTQQDRLWGHMHKANGKGGCRIPTERLHRSTPDGAWATTTTPASVTNHIRKHHTNKES